MWRWWRSTRPPGPGSSASRASFACPTADVEPALAVVDDWQARGLGTVLLAALVNAARAQGVRRFQAYVLADNADMLRLLAGVGTLRTSWAGPAVHVTVDLPAPARHHTTAPAGRMNDFTSTLTEQQLILES